MLCGILIILALVFVAYRPILPGNFIMDDRRLVETDNPLVNGEFRPATIWFQTDFVVSDLAFWAEWREWGKNPGPYHIVNMLLHAVSAVLLWQVLARLKIPGAWVAGVVFAVHPVCVNSVARIAELKNTLSLPLFLLSLWFYLPGASNKGESAIRYVLSFLFFILALMAKTSTIMLPVVLLVVVAWQNGRITRVDMLRSSPFFLLAFFFGMMSAWFQKHQAMVGSILAPESLAQRVAGAGRVFWFYLGKVALPVNLNLVYPHWQADTRSIIAFVPDILFCAIMLVCWRFRRGWGRHALLGLGAFAIMLFPVLGLIDSQFLTRWRVSDHLQYLPMFAPVALVAGGLAAILPKWLFRGAAAGIILLLALLTFQRARVFASEETLFHDTLAKNPMAWGMHNDLGVMLAAKKDYPAAEAQLKESLQENPDNADAESNLGQVLVLQGRQEEAASHFENALKIKPDNGEAHRRYGSLLLEQRRWREALFQYRMAMDFSPKSDVRTRLDYATCLHQAGRLRLAMEQYRKVLAIDPNSTEALNNLAWLLAAAPDDKLRDGPEAVKLAERASHLPPVRGMCVPGTLAAAYAEAGSYDAAIATAEKAIKEERAAGETHFADLNQQLLILYRAHHPFREPPMANDTQ